MRIRWPNFHLASFLDAYYHPKNRMMPGPGRSSAGLATDRSRRRCLSRPNQLDCQARASRHPAGPTRPAGFQIICTRRHLTTTDRRSRHEEVCSNGGKPVGCRAGREFDDECGRADHQDRRDRAIDRVRSRPPATMSTNGAKIAADEINAKGGVLGQKIELVIEDNKSNPTEAAVGGREAHVRDKVPVMMGAWGSSLTLAVMPKLMEYKVPMLVETSSSGKITTSGNPYIFRISPPSAVEAVAFAKILGQAQHQEGGLPGHQQRLGPGHRAKISARCSRSTTSPSAWSRRWIKPPRT